MKMREYLVEGIPVKAATPSAAVRKVRGKVPYGHWEEVSNMRGWNQEISVTYGNRTWFFVAMDNG